MNQNDKSAFVTIIGRPNVGKSSLLNHILKTKIAAVSNKPQTTRTRITGIYTKDEYQLVFIDTPGMHTPRTELGKYMVKSINESVQGGDVCILVVEATEKPGKTDLQLIKKLKNSNIPAILAINKIDVLKDKNELLSLILEYSKLYNFDSIIPISATNGTAINELIDELKKFAIEGGHFFDDDALTDQPEKVIAAEIIREKILRFTDKEIPHGTAVIIESMKQREDKNIIDIDAYIYCEKNSHKGILIGKKGAMLKKISTYAREDMEKFFDCKINLQTWIKVKEDWRNKQVLLTNFGYDSRNFE